MKVLIIGVNGQDGSFLAEAFLKSPNYRVFGIGKQQASVWIPENAARFTYLSVDLTHPSELFFALESTSPDVIYHMAAVHGPEGFDYDSRCLSLIDVNVRSCMLILDYLKRSLRHTRYFYASSSKVFQRTPCFCEQSLERVTCLYTWSKVAARTAIDYYRENDGIQASIIWFFNHESSRRKEGFFFSKVRRLVLNALEGRSESVGLFGDLNFWADWGSAKEYMGLIADNQEKLSGESFVLCTGNTQNAANAVWELFDYFNLDAAQYLPSLSPRVATHPSWRAKSLTLEKLSIELPAKGLTEVLFESINESLVAGAGRMGDSFREGAI